MVHRISPLLLALVAVAAVAQPAASIRICDASGCSDRPRQSATFDPSRDENPEESRRLAALTDIASKDPRAAFDLGLRFFRGDGVRQNSYQALQWMRNAAERGDLQAQLAVGRFYLMGLEEMGADPAEAEKWLSMAAGRGNPEAQKLLAEASAAKQTEQALYQWRERHRTSWYGWWATDYLYYGYWGPAGWYFR